MAGHSSACLGSAKLCQKLFDALNQKIPNVIYKQGKNKCSFGAVGGRKIFAWVNSHSSRNPQLNVWFLGGANQSKQFIELSINPRHETDGSWAEYGGSFTIKNDKQLAEAVEFLVSISYPTSIH